MDLKPRCSVCGGQVNFENLLSHCIQGADGQLEILVHWELTVGLFLAAQVEALCLGTDRLSSTTSEGYTWHGMFHSGIALEQWTKIFFTFRISGFCFSRNTESTSVFFVIHDTIRLSGLVDFNYPQVIRKISGCQWAPQNGMYSDTNCGLFPNTRTCSFLRHLQLLKLPIPSFSVMLGSQGSHLIHSKS